MLRGQWLWKLQQLLLIITFPKLVLRRKKQLWPCMAYAKTSELRTPGASHLPGERSSWEAVVQAGGNWLHEDQGAWQQDRAGLGVQMSASARWQCQL